MTALISTLFTMCPAKAHEDARFFSVSPGFFLMTLWFGFRCGWRVLGLVLTAALVHEGGHWLALCLMGGRPKSLCLGMMGAVMEIDTLQLSYGREWLVTVAGPVANLAAAMVLSVIGGGLWSAWAGANVVLAIYNLVPLRPLDGGRALYLASARWLGPDGGEALVRWSGTVFGLAAAAGLIFLVEKTGGSLWLLLTAAGLCAAVAKEWQKE